MLNGGIVAVHGRINAVVGDPAVVILQLVHEAITIHVVHEAKNGLCLGGDGVVVRIPVRDLCLLLLLLLLGVLLTPF